MREAWVVPPAVSHQIGLVMERREPHSPVLEAFKTQARRVGGKIAAAAAV